MARTANETVRALRRDQFLDTAQRLVEAKGYEQMSVQDVLTELGASKGAFYHYFSSKQDLLRALADRAGEALATHLTPIVADQGLTAVDKLNQLFAAVAGWKMQRLDLLTAMVRAWYSDGNAIARQKVRADTVARMTPLLGEVVAQGIKEGTFSAGGTAELGRLVASLIQDLNDRLAEPLIEFEVGNVDVAAMEEAVAVYTRAVERILGLPEQSVTLVSPDVLRTWLKPQGATAETRDGDA